MPKIILPVILSGLFMLSVVSTADTVEQDRVRFSPYSGSPPLVTLTDKEHNKLEQGKSVYKKIIMDEAKRGVAIFRVKASRQKIWSVIRDFDSYPGWIKGLVATEVYSESDNLISVKFIAENRFSGETIWHAIHNYPKPGDARQWGTWILDYNKESDFADSIGFWRVVPVPDVDNENTVIYSADIRFKNYMPRFIENLVVSRGIKQASVWVKQQSESVNHAED